MTQDQIVDILKSPNFCGVCAGRLPACTFASKKRRECCGIVGCKALAAAGFEARRAPDDAGGGGDKARRKKKSGTKKESEAAAAAGAADVPEAAEGAAADSTAEASHVLAEEASVPSVETAGVFSWDGDDDHPLVGGDAAAT